MGEIKFEARTRSEEIMRTIIENAKITHYAFGVMKQDYYNCHFYVPRSISSFFVHLEKTFNVSKDIAGDVLLNVSIDKNGKKTYKEIYNFSKMAPKIFYCIEKEPSITGKQVSDALIFWNHLMTLLKKKKIWDVSKGAVVDNLRN